MKPGAYLNVAGPNIIHEDFGDETVVVNLESGRYYAFNTSGGEIWSRVQAGVGRERLLGDLGSLFEAELATIEEETDRFLGELLSEGLIAEQGETAAGTQVPSPAPPEARSPFEPPSMERFDDMEDLLMLDPIHDVDESGWPHPMTGGDPEKPA